MYVLEWTTISLGTGVLGGAGYEAAKHAFDVARKRRRLFRYPRISRENAVILGRAAVGVYCAERNLAFDQDCLRERDVDEGRSRSWYMVFEQNTATDPQSSTQSPRVFHVRVYGNPNRVDVALG
ncbi:hypothetical protein [Streptomyces chartreusis]